LNAGNRVLEYHLFDHQPAIIATTYREELMNMERIGRYTATLTLALLLGAPLALSQTAAQPAEAMHHGMMHGQEHQGDMPAKCKAMMQKKQQRMQKCKMMDAKLDELVAAMNAATGQQKVDAMAAVLNELVAQRKAMRQMMMEMHDGMKCGMKKSCCHGKDDKHKCTMMHGKMKEKMESMEHGGEPAESASGK